MFLLWVCELLNRTDSVSFVKISILPHSIFWKKYLCLYTSHNSPIIYLIYFIQTEWIRNNIFTQNIILYINKKQEYVIYIREVYECWKQVREYISVSLACLHVPRGDYERMTVLVILCTSWWWWWYSLMTYSYSISISAHDNSEI
jgi:hypothetical protein